MGPRRMFCLICLQSVTSLFDLTFAEPILWAKVRSKYFVVQWFVWLNGLLVTTLVIQAR